MKISALLLASLISWTASASHLSAFRAEGVSAQAYFPSQKTLWGTSAFGQRSPLEELDLAKVPAAPDFDFIRNKFEALRDKRFLTTSGSDFLRRITWLFPDDGCYARAEVLARLLEQEKAPPVAKIFVFGDLKAKTPNSPRGSVSWWYHVAAAYRDRTTVYILDAALEPQRPLTLQEWVARVSSDPDDVRLSICSAKTYEPDSDCYTPEPKSPQASWAEEQRYLPKEWGRLEQLHRDPEKELGEFPPWL